MNQIRAINLKATDHVAYYYSEVWSTVPGLFRYKYTTYT